MTGTSAQPLNLLVITEGYPWGQSLAGVFHRDQLRVMAKSGVNITLVGPTPWVPPGLAARNLRWRIYAEAPLRQNDGDIRILRPRYLALPRENNWFCPDLMQEWAVRRLNLPKPDLIQAFFALPQGAVARKLAKDWGVPYCVGMLGDDVNIYPQHNARNMRLLQAVVRDAALAFANGPTLAATAERLTGCPVLVKPHGVSPSRFAHLPSKAEARAMLGLPADRFLALYVGSLVPTKGMGELARAMDLLADRPIQAVLVGDGEMRAELEVRPNITCLGMQPAETVALAMAAADLHVHPSHYEGLPTALVEGALAGLPILSTDAPGCIDMVADGRGLMVPVGDADALAAALGRAAADPAALQPLVRAMTAHANERYVLETNTAWMVETYRRLAGKD